MADEFKVHHTVADDEKVDLRKHQRFIAKPNPRLESFLEEGISLPVPQGGVQHRILDAISVAAVRAQPKDKGFLHRAHHFAFGLEASEALLYLAAQQDWLDEYQEFAPHPFEEYTVSFWTGSEQGIVEVMLAVHHEGEDPYPEIVTLLWGTTDLTTYHKGGERSWKRDAVMANLDQAPSHQRLAWKFCDAFRLIMARSQYHTINKGDPTRHSIRKGKRVTFYSKSTVTINLDAVKMIRTNFRSGYGRMMPVYQYRSHLCESGGRPSCAHVWIKDEERENPYWTCASCGRRRWHRRAGVRGSAEVGYVRQTYKVIKGQDQ